MTLTPHRFFLITLGIVLLVTFGAVDLSLHQPWMGSTFDLDRHGTAPLKVIKVSEQGPANGLLKPGDEINGIVTTDGQVVPLDSDLLRVYPGTILTYQAYNDFIARLTHIQGIVEAGPITLQLTDGRHVTLTTRAVRPIGSMPSWWYFRLFRTILVILLVAAPLAFHPANSGLRYLALAGIASAGTGFALMPLEGCELFIDGRLMHKLYLSIWATELVFSGSLLALMWNYPYRLPGHRHTWILLPVFASLWVIHALQGVSSLALMQGVPALIFYLFGSALQWGQWRRSAPGSAQRRTVLWFIFCIGGAVTWFMLLLIAPLLLNREPASGVQIISLSSLFVFAGLSFGIYRDKLFNVDRWVANVWLMLLAASLSLALDLLLLITLDLKPGLSIVVTLAAIAWIYLPLRSAFLMHWWQPDNRQHLRDTLRELIEIGFGADSRASKARHWHRLLQRLFQPLHIDIRTDDAIADQQVYIADAGRALLFPALPDSPALRLMHADKGRRFFFDHDAKLGTLLARWFTQACTLRSNVVRGAQAERDRVARDMHDDVVPHLLSLIYRTDGHPLNGQMRELMFELRRIIRALKLASVPDLTPAANLSEQAHPQTVRAPASQRPSLRRRLLQARGTLFPSAPQLIIALVSGLTFLILYCAATTLHWRTETALLWPLAITGWLTIVLGNWLRQKIDRWLLGVDYRAEILRAISDLLRIERQDEIAPLWTATLQRLFASQSIERATVPVTQFALSASRRELRIPDLHGTPAIVIVQLHRWRPRFRLPDYHMTQELWSIFDLVKRALAQFEQGEANERARLADLILRQIEMPLAASAADPCNAHWVDLLLRTQTELACVRQALVEKTTHLEELIRMIASESAERLSGAGIALECSIDPASQGHRISTRTAINIRRVIREATTNLLRHAQARQALLTFSLSGPAPTLQVELEDDGRGMQAASGSQGYGMQHMRDRATEINASLSFHSGTHKGTRIVLVSQL